MQEIEKYVHRLFKNTPHQEATVNQIIEMLCEKVEDLKEAGFTEKDAVHKSIVEFGDLEDYYIPSIDKEKRRYKRIKTIQHYRNDLLFASLSTCIIVGILAGVNLIYFRNLGYWFIIPSLGLLFWPLSLLYKLLNRKGD